MTKSNKILIGADEICNFMGGVDRRTLGKWIDKGLPVKKEEGRLVAHAENLEYFFKNYTSLASSTALQTR